MTKRKIMPGDSYITPSGSVRICNRIESGTIISNEGYHHEIKRCTRLPASPKEMVKLWKLAEKMHANWACRLGTKQIDRYCKAKQQIHDIIDRAKSKRKGTK